MKKVCENPYFDVVETINPTESFKVFEHYTATKLAERYHSVQEQVVIGVRECDIEHCIDVVVGETKTLVECKIKNTPGTADQKLKTAVYDLQYALDNFKMKDGSKYENAVLFLGGTKWVKKYKDWFRYEYIKNFPNISVSVFEEDPGFKDV